jgi:hypothetical protein
MCPERLLTIESTGKEYPARVNGRMVQRKKLFASYNTLGVEGFELNINNKAYLHNHKKHIGPGQKSKPNPENPGFISSLCPFLYPYPSFP